VNSTIRRDWSEGNFPRYSPMSRINAKIKIALDPNNMANPTRYINIEKMEIAKT